MDLEPRVPSEGVIDSVIGCAAGLTVAFGSAFALDLVHARWPAALAVACAALVLGFVVARKTSPPRVVFALLAVPAALAALASHQPVLACGAGGAAGGLAAGVILRPLFRAHAMARAEGALDRLECVALAAARPLLSCGVVGLFARGGVAHLLAGLSCVCALVLVGVAAMRDRARARGLRRVYAGEDPSFRVERDADVRGYELLPPVLSGTLTNAVIAHVHAGAATYRSSDGPRPLARCDASLPKTLGRIARRGRAMATLGVGLFACAALMPLSSTRAASPKSASASVPSAPPAPACTEARLYFADVLENGGFGRATLLTHDQDPAIASGDGVLLVVPSGQARTATATEKSRALSLAQGIPCTGKLALRVEDPQLKPFTVEATLVLEAGADESRAVADANEQVRELFQPDSRTILNEHVGFGESEKTFGYRVRHVLRHIEGVRGVRLTVNGSERDVALAPRDFPTLESLSIRAER